MGSLGQTSPSGGSFTITGVDTTTTQFNIALGVADTEQSQALPANTKQFILKTRGTAELKLAYTINGSGSLYVTIPPNAVFTDDNFHTAQTIFFQSPQINDTVEIVAYV